MPERRLRRSSSAGSRICCLKKKLDEERPDPLADEVFAEQIKLLIEAAQLEILHNDVPSVVSDVLEEQTLRESIPHPAGQKPPQTSRLRADGGADDNADLFSFRQGGGAIDRFVGTVAAAAQSFTLADQLKDDDSAPLPRETKRGKIFRYHYRVGTEELLRDLPSLALLEIWPWLCWRYATASRPSSARTPERSKNNMLFSLGVDLPLRTF